ncbi:MAG: hypothetical protein OEZ24_01520 [Candidatus Bathyarchaeota archaeon]|nr:hypothetical protein [Candidatus Bathyarchaeota archaeon]
MGTGKGPEGSKIPDILRAVEELRCQLRDFERLREETRAAIESAVKLIPSLEDRKSLLQEDLERTKGKLAQTDSLIRDLGNAKAKIQEDVQLRQDQISHIDNQIRALTRVMNLEL